MSLFDKFKTKDEAAATPVAHDVKPAKTEKTAEKPMVKAEKAATAPKKDHAPLKGVTEHAHRILIKPLITEKATYLGALNKYVFAVDRSANKVEVKKAIRTAYHVDPIAVHIANFSGKEVRSGRVLGKTKNWKKAIVTLKAGDKIEVYEGV